MAAKRDSRRHSTSSFSDNVVLWDKSYSVIGFIISRLADSLTSSNQDNTANSKRCTMSYPGCLLFENTREKNFKLNLVLVVVLVLESKGLYYYEWLKRLGSRGPSEN